jgi:hypothetical protein
MNQTNHLRDPRDIDWRLVLAGWLIGLFALVLLLLSVTGNGTGPAGLAALRSILWVWAAILIFAAAWYLLLRGLPWPSPLRRHRLKPNAPQELADRP